MLTSIFSIAAPPCFSWHSDWQRAHGAYGNRIIQVCSCFFLQPSCSPCYLQRSCSLGCDRFRFLHFSCSDIVPRTCANFKVIAYALNLPWSEFFAGSLYWGGWSNSWKPQVVLSRYKVSQSHQRLHGSRRRHHAWKWAGVGARIDAIILWSSFLFHITFACREERVFMASRL